MDETYPPVPPKAIKEAPSTEAPTKTVFRQAVCHST